MEFAHQSVLLNECIDALAIKPDGIYLDGTLGGAGHSLQICRNLTTGRLIGVDRDLVALEAAKKRLYRHAKKVTLVHDNFENVGAILTALGLDRIDGMLFDLGVSSPQLDDAERGFSYMADAPLDMRMDREQSLTAYEIVNNWPREELKSILYEYGEERYAPQIAAAIERVREKAEAFSSRSAQDDLLALPKGDKMEFIVQKAVELGVSRIVPYLSKNCVSRPDKTEKKVERWRKIAAEAAKQCGRGRLPEVAAVVPVAQAIAQAAESETALFFYENERRTGLHDALAGGVRDTVSLMVGPEGGFDPAEARAAVDAGLQSVSLGTRILRCETAPIAALAAVLYAGGNM